MREGKRILQRFIDLARKKGDRRTLISLKGVCSDLFGAGFDHPGIVNLVMNGTIDRDEVLEIQSELRHTLKQLAKGHPVTATLPAPEPETEAEKIPAPDIHLIGALPSKSRQASTRVQVDNDQPLGKALIAIFLQILHFSPVRDVSECPICNKYFLRFSRKRETCSDSCKQKRYRDSLSPKKKQEQARARSNRYHRKKANQG